MNNLGRGKENEKKDKNKLLSRETVGIVLELFAALTLVIVVTDNLIFGASGMRSVRSCSECSGSAHMRCLRHGSTAGRY